MTTERPDIVVVMTDEERATPPYEPDTVRAWRSRTLGGRRWFDENGVSFLRHYTGSLACVPSRPTIFTGQYPDLHGVTQTDGIGKAHDDSRLRWLRRGEVPTLGNWLRAAGYDTHYDGKWHISHADLIDPGTGRSLDTNDDDGVVDPAAVHRYLEADPLSPYGFSGWVGPEPHGAKLSNAGIRRDPLIADRVVAWLKDRYARRRAGDPDAMRPFLLVASFVNPHDIVLFPAWARRNPLPASPLDPPPVPAAPTADEDLSTKPAAQIAFREAYYSGYGPAWSIERTYRRNAQRYRDLYYRLHAEVDTPIDRVRRAVTEGGSGDGPDDTVLVRTADHGDLLGAHGGLHQKWFNLYDEATRVPFVIARVGARPTTARTVTAPTSHVDLVPTLLSAAGVDVDAAATVLAESFSEVHPLPGSDLMPVVDGAPADDHRCVYLMTRDNVLEGDTGASGLARALKLTSKVPAPLRIRIPAHTAANFEGLVIRVDEDAAPGGHGHLWKLVRSFDDPGTWTEPGVRHLAAGGIGGPMYRTDPLDDQWELYDLTDDPVEQHNRWTDPDLHELRAHLRAQLKSVRAESIPERNRPWPYVRRQPPQPARWSLGRALRRLRD
ncbi:sulfatase-like hydrolase/transferase [Mycolicibacterium austroafricanum]|uniref:Sulfatase-like hydrolase/transferase n=1 Tax=Mycolicibacterium austroafricanum TaxID=39687 RepID=A0ABT8HBZ3_MYCAO|nr:sulfatase-like hydrolase/transferase [Mycolicibacterium austroafricanum]MDN4518293.1 sulfatase-like hydrolase/transferase [Mycolicibacterium austroafricanum]PQP51287.1 hydrolase [Mycolicibacterium austroafricanum]QRZ05389.1 sulfatase-like hydrolase/transferase [Mycolicibacterium austroafricanum]QZT66952.1 sulfatase-like hydrolase/transferase [Mycolicibacterium austroafricanum]